ncbi:MAG TPA: ABC transporter permease subunit, partial [Burkholderiales bacterium]|nr:ABC transporter permease subunit [Burkholderiales bacterium]
MNTSRSRLTWSLIIIVGLLTLCPVVMLFLGSFSEGLTGLGKFTLEKYVAAYTDPALAGVTLNTIIFVLGSSLLATVLAVVLAYLNTRTDIPFKSLFGVLSIVPMMIPHLLFAVSWALLLNPSNGIINVVLRDVFSLSHSPFNVYSLPGMVMVEGLLNMPIAYLIIAPAMMSFDVALEESSRVFGAGTWRTLLRVTLPVLRPAILAAFILGVVRSLASYAVPEVLGMPGRIKVLATYLYQMISIGFSPDYGKAAALGMSMLAASIGLIVLYRALTAESGKFVTISGRGYRPTVIEL